LLLAGAEYVGKEVVGRVVVGGVVSGAEYVGKRWAYDVDAMGRAEGFALYADEDALL